MEGDIDQGISYYKKALYYNWHYADAMYNLGVAYGEMLKFDMVSFLLLQWKPLIWIFSWLVASIWDGVCNQFLFVQAIVFYELAFHFNPHCAEACNNLGVIYKDRDNLDKAVECYQAMFDTFTNDSFIFLSRILTLPSPFWLSYLFITNLQMALSIKPNFSQSLNNLGVVYTVQVFFQCFLGVRILKCSYFG